ncbi:MAG: DNA alkylation repair protein [Ignavibacteria bacterium RBG_16_34_14]|nr:MAG: DNA alkylation repair protein [Ignavibacteria bacterium RBG_16_34_14]
MRKTSNKKLNLAELKKTVKENSNAYLSEFLQRFFKTGKGDYAEGDLFAGIKVPVSRKIAKQFNDLPLNELSILIKSKIHEERLIALFILVDKMKKADETKKEKIYKLYLKNLKYINNWDLVDLSAGKIIGEYLFDKEKKLLFELSEGDLWEKRIAIMSTLNFIKKKDYKTTLTIAKLLLKDKHDLIHKAVGWMLREIGNRDIETEEYFLKIYYKNMPRTMLRYAIEKFPEVKRQAYLKGKI